MTKYKLYQVYVVSADDGGNLSWENEMSHPVRHVAILVGEKAPEAVLRTVGRPVRASSPRAAVRKVNTRTKCVPRRYVNSKNLKEGNGL